MKKILADGEDNIQLSGTGNDTKPETSDDDDDDDVELAMTIRLEEDEENPVHAEDQRHFVITNGAGIVKVFCARSGELEVTVSTGVIILAAA